METIKLSSRDRLVVPAPILAEKKRVTALEFTVEPTSDSVLLRAIKRKPKTPLSKLIGCVKYTGYPISIEKMDEAITLEVKTRHARGRY
jgi:hypothetical protein